MWTGSPFAQRLKGIWRCLFPVVRIDWIEPDTPRSSVCCFSYSLPNPFSFKTTRIYCFCNVLSLMLCLPSSLMPLDLEISSSSLPLAAHRLFYPFFLCLVRFGRSSCSSFFQALRFIVDVLLVLLLLYHHPLSAFSFFSLIIWAFA